MHLRESGLWGVLHAAEAVGGKARAQAERGTHPRTGGRSLGSQVPSYPGKPTLLKCKYLLTSHQVLKIVNCRETTALSHSMSSLGTDQSHLMLLCKRLQYTWTQLAQWVGTERGPEDSGGLQISALQREAENVSVTGQLPPGSLKTKHGFFLFSILTLSETNLPDKKLKAISQGQL